MPSPPPPGEDAARLRRCLNDLVGVMALPALWANGEPPQIVGTLVDALMGMLGLVLVYARFADSSERLPTEVSRLSGSWRGALHEREIGSALEASLGDGWRTWPARVRMPIAGTDLSVACARLGLRGDFGTVVVASERVDFPEQDERLVLDVAVNQAAMALQQARLLAEQALERSERTLKVIVDTIPALAWSALPDGTADFFNQHYLDYIGFTADRAAGWGWTTAVHPEDVNGLAAAWQRIMASGAPGDAEARLRRHDGEYRWFLFRTNPLRDDAGTTIRWYGTNTDIDDRKRAEDALRASERRLHQMTETIPEMLWSATAEGAIDYCNSRFLAYTGTSADDVMGDGWRTTLHPEDSARVAPIWQAAVSTATQYRVEVRTFHAASGTYRLCAVTALPLVDEQGRILKWHGTIVDMQDWKQAQEELRSTQAALAHVTRVMTMGELTASIAHEVNQPLSGIVTNANTCLRMLAGDPPDVDGARETARRTIRDGNRASDVIERLRALFRKEEIATEAVDLNDAIREVLALSSSELQRNQVALRSDLAERMPAVTGDRVQLQQVVLNLIMNASDAMSGVEGRDRQLVIRTALDEREHVRVSVQDSGVGFEPQALERLFAAFYTTKRTGMGMGLSVCRSIVTRHRGRLWAELNDGPGATFSFAVPCRPAVVLNAGGTGA